ncbi:acyltransferase family protein [Streptomyces nogalater]
MAQTQHAPESLTGTEGKRPPLASLTGMRGVASVIVFLCHIIILAGDLPYEVDVLTIFEDPEIRETYRSVFGFVGYTCVSFFFVTSGFILTWASRPNDTLARFWRRRFFKIFPLHLVTYGIGMLVLTGANTGAKDLPAIFLVQNWVPDTRVIFSANGPSWSISAEVFFYFLFPFVLLGIRKIKETHLYGWLGAWWWPPSRSPPSVIWRSPGTPGLVQLCVPAGAHAGVRRRHHRGPPDPQRPLAQRRVRSRGPAAGRLLLCRTAVAGGVRLRHVHLRPRHPDRRRLHPGRSHRPRTLMRGRRLVWLGDLSFAFYLVHLSVMLGARKLIGQDKSWGVPGALLFIVTTYAITLVCAWILHTCVEKPVMRRWSSPRRKPKPAEEAPAALSRPAEPVQ